MNYSWSERGKRKVVPYENPQRRRVNAVGVLIPYGDNRSLWWDAVPRSIRSDDVLTVIEEVREKILQTQGELVIVLDNASIHHSRKVKDAKDRARLLA